MFKSNAPILSLAIFLSTSWNLITSFPPVPPTVWTILNKNITDIQL